MKKTCFIILVLLSAVSFAQNIFKNEFEQNIAIRVSQLELVDPHVYVLLFGIACTDLTGELNSQVQTQISEDSNNDGYLDSNLITQLSSDQPAYITSRSLNATAIDGRCPDPLHSSACEISSAPQNTVATNFSEIDECLAPITNTTSGYNPAPNTSNAPCYATLPVTSSISFAGTEVGFQGFQQAARYQGDLDLDNGLRMGFISESDAQSVVFPDTTPVIGGQTLASLLPGGMGNCSSDDDRDVFTDGKTSGWWFYFNTSSELIELQ